jgi:hypothetical protein
MSDTATLLRSLQGVTGKTVMNPPKLRPLRRKRKPIRFELLAPCQSPGCASRIEPGIGMCGSCRKDARGR